jgi:hypothetical protein
MEKNKNRKTPQWNPTGVSSKGRTKNGWREEALNDVKKLKVKKWT